MAFLLRGIALRLFMRLLLITLSCWVPALAAAQLVRVGAYHFPPYVIKPESEEPSGVLPELLAALNSVQDDYRFSLVPTSVTRRYRDFQQARYDLILFESPEWGWQGIELDKLDLQIIDAEVYVARKQAGRDQSFFDSLKGKRMALYTGYHYAFANFNAEQNYLVSHFQASLTYSHDSNLLMLLHDRADVSVVTRSYLPIFEREYPVESQQLLISQRVDQIYRHHALLRPGAPLNSRQLASLLQLLRDGGKLPALLARYQLQGSAEGNLQQSDPIRH